MALPEDLDVLLERESDRVEWKKAEDLGEQRLEEIVETLAAFANDAAAHRQGGWLLCGVEEVKDEHGFVRPRLRGLPANKLQEIRGKVRTLCRERVSPPLIVQDFSEPLDDDPARRLLVFYAAASPYVHTFRRRNGETGIYVRLEDETREARGEQLRSLQRRKRDLPPYLDQPCPDATLEDLNPLALEEFIREAGLPLPPAEYLTSGATIGEGAGPLVVELGAGKALRLVPTYLALLLFGRRPTDFLPGAYAILSFYDGTSRADLHSLRHESSAPLPKLVRDLLERLRLYTGTEIDKSASALEGPQNRPRFSEKALQETVVNAFAHRDYEAREPVRITVFADRIEVFNSGGVVPELDSRRVREGRSVAHWRNPSLARFLFKMGLAQNEGQGIPTILKETRAVAGRDAELRPGPGTFEVVLPAARSMQFVYPEAINGTQEGQLEGLVLVSIGAESIRPVVESSLASLGLEEAEIAADIPLPEYVSPDQEHWEAAARQLRQTLSERVEDPRYSRLHLFYRGPVVLAPLVGALIAPAKPLVVYHYENGRYTPAYVLDRKLLRSRT